ncbi:DUF998 domain-containing protein [Rhizohabitans arisaemae]|uniref:DUF998 domain-containing protein n=1 Tax=Rhizohabitans arisaemae TaxID=2720610 RepID=UPI0024B04615|nr:DUF998 domain-containing protein [Rhizohabitans arisaemae]
MTRTYARLTVTGTVLAFAFMIYLHMAIGTTGLISVYAHHPDGAAVLGASMASLAAGLVALGLALSKLRPGVHPLAQWLLALAALGLLLAAYFPTDPGADVVSLSGYIHRYGAGAALLGIPGAGLLVARRLAGIPELEATARIVTWIAGGCLLGVAGLLLTSDGLAQRTVLFAEIILMLVLAASLLGRRGPAKGDEPAADSPAVRPARPRGTVSGGRGTPTRPARDGRTFRRLAVHGRGRPSCPRGNRGFLGATAVAFPAGSPADRTPYRPSA